MKTFLSLGLFFFLLGTLGVLRAAERPNLAGTWRIDQPRAGGVTLHTYFTFRPTADAFEGSLVINDAVEIPMDKPRFEGDEAVFETFWHIDFRFRAKGDQLDVTVIHDKKKTERAVAVRVPASATQPPAKQPLPDFVPLPPNGLALTPPMGWNSWNHFADRVDDRVIREVADAMVNNGLAAAGYVYINIDDTWEGGRDAEGNIVPNSKFPDMKALADYVHARGLKLGIYSSPGPRTCGGYEGSYGHEEQDAKTFAAWGIDYLKYDWCSAQRLYGYTDENLRGGFLKMGQALAKCGRPIVYSICEYGSGDVWKWGPLVGGNLWRTTGDIRDEWASMTEIGFNQGKHAPYAGPGHWNDPDMLEVGNGGMTATEYRTHFSLWCLLAAPLMAGNDVRSMSAEPREILGNREAIAIDQDPLGQQATRVAARDDLELWAKPLQDGGLALGLFNRSEREKAARFTWQETGLANAPQQMRDLWQHRNLTPSASGLSHSIPAHGVVLLRVK